MGLLEMYGGVPFLLILLYVSLAAASFSDLADDDQNMHNFLFCVRENLDKGDIAELRLPSKCEPSLEKLLKSTKETLSAPQWGTDWFKDAKDARTTEAP